MWSCENLILCYDAQYMRDVSEYFKGKKITVMGRGTSWKPLGFPTLAHTSLTAFRHGEPHGSPTPSLARAI